MASRDRGLTSERLDRLHSAINHSRMMLRMPREEYRESVRTYAGAHWSEQTAGKRVPVNVLGLYVNIVPRELVPQSPRVMWSTGNRAYRQHVATMQDWMNDRLEQMDMGAKFQRFVLDAIFSVGIMQVQIATPQDAVRMNWGVHGGCGFAARVGLDDWVFDPHARDLENPSWMGHRYRARLDTIKDDPRFPAWRKNLVPTDNALINREGDERTSTLGRGYYGDQAEVYEWIDLWQIWFPHERLIVTIPDEQAGGPKGEPLNVQRWIGPAKGPYHILGLGLVPDNAMPLAPVHNLIDLHHAVNETYRKMHRMVRRTKVVTAYEGSAAEDVTRLEAAEDGMAVKVENLDKIKPMAFGTEALVAITQAATVFKDLFSFIGGNIELLGGRQQMARTATQEKMLAQNANASLSDVRGKTYTAINDVLTALGWYYHHDPIAEQRATYSPPGLPNHSVERTVTPADRQQIPWEALKCRLDVYSLQPRDPQARLAFLRGIVGEMMQMMPLLQSKGIDFDIDFYLQKVSEYGDEPDIRELFTVRPPPPTSPGGGATEMPHDQTLPPQTERTYTRAGGGQPQTDSSILAGNHMKLGGNPQTTTNNGVAPVGA